MHASTSALIAKPKTSHRNNRAIEAVQDMKSLRERIAQRAFEIFADNGRHIGHELADWFQAEMEFLHPTHIQVRESADGFTVYADVPGFQEKDLQVKVEPQLITIAGKRESKKEPNNTKTIYTEMCSDQVLRVISLPSAVNTAKVRTTLTDGILEMDLPKAKPDQPAKTDPATK